MSSLKVVLVDPDASVCVSMPISPLYTDSHTKVCVFVLGFFVWFGFFASVLHERKNCPVVPDS